MGIGSKGHKEFGKYCNLTPEEAVRKLMSERKMENEIESNKDVKYEVKYNLTFTEAIECVINCECWVQGNDFVKGTVLSLKDGVVIVSIFGRETCPVDITTGLYHQKFRKVYTQPDAKNNR